MALFSMFFFVSLYMQLVLGYDALEAGLAYLPLAVGIIVSAGIASGAGDEVRLQAGPRSPASCSPRSGSCGSRRSRSAATTSATSCSRRCSRPSASGFAFVPMTIGAVSGVAPHEAGLASGLINTSQQIGGALGLAILASIANSKTDEPDAGRGRRPGGAAERADRGLPDRVPGRRRVRGRRRDPRGDADLVARRAARTPRPRSAARSRPAPAVA